jgi:GntR family transcriptional regulator
MEKGESKKMTLFDILESNFKDPIRYAIAEIESTVVDDTLARLLKVEKGKSLVVMKEVHRDISNIPLLYSIDYINTSVFRIQVLRKKI